MSFPPSAQRLTRLAERFPAARVWVAGDVMLDEYVVGSVGRISPEAPVPVVSVDDAYSLLGGAANAARSIAAFGAEVVLLGVIGDDPAGEKLVGHCRQMGIQEHLLARVDDHPTTRKTRVLGPRQQLLRLDRESTEPVDDGLIASAIERLAAGPAPTAVVLSDYGKGFLTRQAIRSLIEAAGSVPVLVDPTGRSLARYRGASVVKPNLREMELLTGRDLKRASVTELERTARTVLGAGDVRSLVLTLGERGMLVVPPDGEAKLIPAQRREVYDVTGAGDTVMGALAAALSVGGDLMDAARIATCAAGMVVDEVGAAAVKLERLLAELAGRQISKAFDWDNLAEQLTSWRRRGKRIVFTNGCFDLLHAGHLWLLNRAAELGDVLVVGLNSDASIKRLKGDSRPLVSEEDRVDIVAALQCVDAVAVFKQDTPLELIEWVRPDVLVKGRDYSIDEVVGREQVEAGGGTVVLVPLLPERSTSSLLERIRRRVARTSD